MSLCVLGEKLGVESVFAHKIAIAELGEAQFACGRTRRFCVQCRSISSIKTAVPEIQQLGEAGLVVPIGPTSGHRAEYLRLSLGSVQTENFNFVGPRNVRII